MISEELVYERRYEEDGEEKLENDKSLCQHIFSVYRQHRVIFPEFESCKKDYVSEGAIDFMEVIAHSAMIGEIDDSGRLIRSGVIINSIIKAMTAKKVESGLDKISALLGINDILGFRIFENPLVYKLRLCMEGYGLQLLGYEETRWKQRIVEHIRTQSLSLDLKTEFGVDEPEREIASGKLTQRGKHQLANEGLRLQKLHVRSVAFSYEPIGVDYVRKGHIRDPLEMPIMSLEWPWLTSFLCRFSKLLNARWNLPRDKGSEYKYWSQIFVLSFPKSGMETYTLTKKNLSAFIGSFRINLRIFANIKLSSGLSILFLLVFFYRGLLSIFFMMVLAAPLVWIYNDGTNHWLPFPNHAI